MSDELQELLEQMVEMAVAEGIDRDEMVDKVLYEYGVHQ